MEKQQIKFTLSELRTCSGCNAWVELMLGRSFTSTEEATAEARKTWWQQVPVTGWLEAVRAHPRLGDGAAVHKKRQASTTDFQFETVAEQDKLLEGGNEFSRLMQEWNRKYEAKFGHVFLFAQGKSPEQVLQCIEARFHNSPLAELRIAAQQEILIIEERLRNCLHSRARGRVQANATQRTGTLLRQLDSGAHGMDLLHADLDTRPQVTCHVLDTARGCPAVNLPIALLRSEDGSRPQDGVWAMLNTVNTNADGRAHGLSKGVKLFPGLYRVAFATSKYYADIGMSDPFYPQPVVDFTVTYQTVDQHFHIPLLISPFSYSTYRGS